MNRSILIVICDFLLVSLLAFSSVDINNVSEEGAMRPVQTEFATNQLASGNDLAAVMRLALDEERKSRDQLQGELTKARDETGKQQVLLSERAKQVQTVEQQLQAREQQQTGLQQQFAAAQTNLQTLNQRLQSTSTEASLSKEKIAAMEAELRKQKEQAAALQQQLAQQAGSNQMVLNEKQKLAGQLQLAEVEKRHATEQAARMQEQVKIEREEKARLVEGVKSLASKSGELAQEIRENRPLSPNTIFDEFVANRVQAQFHAARSGLFGANRNKAAQTVLITDGTNTFALCHVQDTPLTLSTPGTDWHELTGTLARDTAQVPIRSLSFHLQDPRIVLIPVTPAEAARLGGKVYRVSPDPFKFQDAVLIGAQEGYYGECKFEIDLSATAYVKLDRNLLKGLFGKFNPSSGDLVFSKTGELLGIMANGTYCLKLNRFDASATFQFGADVRAQGTGETLARLYAFVFQMPFKLQ